MDILVWLIVANTALFTLVWLVQLVIYPGLLHSSEVELKKWHPQYTRKVSLIIAPLMLIQAALYGISIFINPSIFSIVGLLLVSSTWLVTFLLAVPLHQAIDHQDETITQRRKLVKVNWYRTIAWTGSLILSVIEYGS